MMQSIALLSVGLMLISQQLDFSAAECNGIYFEMADGIRRPVYPLNHCGQISHDGAVCSYQYLCEDVNGMWMAVQEFYNTTNCSGDVFHSDIVNASWDGWPMNATDVYVQCEEDDCEYTVLRTSDSCDSSTSSSDYRDEMFIVNECIEYDDEDKSEEWTCSEDGVTITYYDGDGCFGSGDETGTANMTDVYFNDSWCINTTSCDEWSVDCATEYSALCAYCAQYAPCINSIDPHCTNHEALGCLECKHYAECAVCAPGWDYGCIAMEWHLNTSCEWPDLVVDNQSISVPARMDGECHYNSIWEQYMTADCKTGEFETDCNEDCTICEESETFSPSAAFDVQITDPLNAECFNYNETDDDTNETEHFSMFVYGHCSYRNMQCPDGNSCGPEACSTNTSSLYYDDYCIEIEVFDEDATCTAESGAGDYTAYAIADNTCRIDGSGRSFYALECAEGVLYGVIGCLDCLCSDNCTDIVLANKGVDGLDGYTPNTCYQYNMTDNLQMAGIINESLLQCSQSRTDITIQAWCDLTHDPTYDPTVEPTAPTSVPSMSPTLEPTMNPSTAAPTTRSPTTVPTVFPTTVSPTGEPTVNSETTTTGTTTSDVWIIATDQWNATTSSTEGGMMNATNMTTTEGPEADYAKKYTISLVGILQMMILSLIST